MDWVVKSSHFIQLQFDVIAYCNVLGWMIVEAEPAQNVRNHLEIMNRREAKVIWMGKK